MTVELLKLLSWFLIELSILWLHCSETIIMDPWSMISKISKVINVQSTKIKKAKFLPSIKMMTSWENTKINTLQPLSLVYKKISKLSPNLIPQPSFKSQKNKIFLWPKCLSWSKLCPNTISLRKNTVFISKCSQIFIKTIKKISKSNKENCSKSLY